MKLEIKKHPAVRITFYKLFWSSKTKAQFARKFVLVPGILLNIQYVCLSDEHMWLLLIRVSSKSVFFCNFVISYA